MRIHIKSKITEITLKRSPGTFNPSCLHKRELFVDVVVRMIDPEVVVTILG